jgi:methylated-DNA-[protein]-cysteine S-methyltransferase
LCIEELDLYLNDDLQKFSVPVAPSGNDFQMSVWQALQNIPYGKTASYLEIARAVGNPAAVRAVGSANNRNRIPIIIPCHRVIGSNGSLVGYAGGIWRKEFLLRLEGAILI